MRWNLSQGPQNRSKRPKTTPPVLLRVLKAIFMIAFQYQYRAQMLIHSRCLFAFEYKYGLNQCRRRFWLHDPIFRVLNSEKKNPVMPIGQPNRLIRPYPSWNVRCSMKVDGYSPEKEDESNSQDRFDGIKACFRAVGVQKKARAVMLEKLESAGWSSSSELYWFAVDFSHRPEILSEILKKDFNFSVVESHKCRAALLQLVRSKNDKMHWHHKNQTQQELCIIPKTTPHLPEGCSHENESLSFGIQDDGHYGTPQDGECSQNEGTADNLIIEPTNEVMTKTQKPKKFKDVVVDARAAARRRRQAPLVAVGGGSGGSAQKGGVGADYGLPDSLLARCPALAAELEGFFRFMTEPDPLRQDPPVRQETAKTYHRHAKLFLGWYLGTAPRSAAAAAGAGAGALAEVSLAEVFPTKEREGVRPAFAFVEFLRADRQCAASYEANVLRGLTKLAKFHFADQSATDPGYGGKSYEDIPVIRELRKMHRDASKRQNAGGTGGGVQRGVSDEDMKWMTWPEYLEVVRAVRGELEAAVAAYEAEFGGPASPATTAAAAAAAAAAGYLGGGGEREGEAAAAAAAGGGGETKERARRRAAALRGAARLYQSYLILALLACVPDRQRTFRELELGTTLVREGNGAWTIRHGPSDYKTGGAYGARPPLPVSPALGPALDEYVARYRPALLGQEAHRRLFAQPRTGRPLTRDSVYQLVARACFRHTGRKTNPHLLRDMVVTHVRGGGAASEQELEALALYMGHSLQTQRQSYDRRTLGEKVAPAVALLARAGAGAGGPPAAAPSS